jgi:hypothetical protein
MPPLLRPTVYKALAGVDTALSRLGFAAAEMNAWNRIAIRNAAEPSGEGNSIERDCGLRVSLVVMKPSHGKHSCRRLRQHRQFDST